LKAIVLVAGYGTRLYPLTLNKAKALLEVGARTILDRIFEKIELVKNCDKICIVTNDKFYGDFKTWAEASAYKKEIEVFNDETLTDETRLGALGDIEFAINKGSIEDDCLIIFGDNLFEFDLPEFFSFVNSKNDPDAAIALFDVKDLELAKKYGIAAVNNSGKITSMEEKPASPKSTLASTGVYYFPKKGIELLKKYIKLGLPKDPPGKFISWLVENHNVYGFIFKDGWYDIGDKKSLKEADEMYKRREKS
jgi:glucose-1-phosphate thymidylyltransferase